MRRTGRAAGAVVTCAAALAAAGCGEDQEFIDDYNTAMKPLQDAHREIAEGGAAGRDARSYRRLADESKKVNRDLADLEAPADAKADFERLRGALRKSEANYDDLAVAIQEDDILRIRSAQQELAEEAEELDRAENAVKRKVED